MRLIDNLLHGFWANDLCGRKAKLLFHEFRIVQPKGKNVLLFRCWGSALFCEFFIKMRCDGSVSMLEYSIPTGGGFASGFQQGVMRLERESPRVQLLKIMDAILDMQLPQGEMSPGSSRDCIRVICFIITEDGREFFLDDNGSGSDDTSALVRAVCSMLVPLIASPLAQFDFFAQDLKTQN